MKIAVIGSGISGLGSAYLLSQAHEVHVFEASNRLGGHAHTTQVQDSAGSTPADTGFLVYNELNYPHLTAMFKHLQVATCESDMSLSIRLDSKNLEWAGTTTNSVFSQRRNLLNPSFLKMLIDILRFHREAGENLKLARRHGWSLQELLRERKYSRVFQEDYLLPMGAAIWSTPEKGMFEFPADTFLSFFLNHKLLQVNDRPVWRTVRNGSIEYVKKIAEQIPNIHLKTPILQVIRSAKGVVLKTSTDQLQFDAVVFATHAPITAKILKFENDLEKSVLESFQTEANKAILHRDASLMPRQKLSWSSWNVLGRMSEDGAKKVCLTYHLNKLQPLHDSRNLFLTLNPSTPTSEPINQFEYDHPLFDRKAIQAQSKIPDIQGVGNVYFAGAWTRYGFHEDGLLSAVNVAKKFGLKTPWGVN